MRYINFAKFIKLVNEECEDVQLLIKILNANDIEHAIHVVFELGIDDETIDSLLEMNLWKNNEHCAIYHSFIVKNKSVGPTTIINTSNLLHTRIVLINKINLDQLLDLYKRTMKLKAFL